MSDDIQPFAEIRMLLANLEGPSSECINSVRDRDRSLTKPPGSLGKLEEIIEWLAAWQHHSTPTIDRPLVAIFAGNHGVAAQGVSAFPSDVTQQMVANFTQGGAAINQICKTYGVGLKVFELALDKPTHDMSIDAAMDEREAAATFAYGFQAVTDGVDLLALGEMGIGNTTSAAAIYTALFGGQASHWTGRGTGIDDRRLKIKIDAIERALSLHKNHLTDPLEVMRRLGGREIAALMGAIIAARINHIPVVLDGYVVCAAAALLHRLNPASLDHCLAGHLSAEGPHAEILSHLGKKPILNLNMRLGEGSGAALTIGLIKAALACHRDMATFNAAGVSAKSASSDL